jgi:hypothetical protein
MSERETSAERAQWLNDVLVTAERAVSYWADSEEWAQDSSAFGAREHDGQGEGGVLHRVDAAVLERGLALLSQPGVKCNRRVRGNILADSATLDPLDLEAADVVVQVGLFGEIVYG